MGRSGQNAPPMDRARTHHELEQALRGPAADLGRRAGREAFRYGVHAGVGLMPVLSGVLTIGFFGGSYVLGRPLFHPAALPVLMLLVPLARGFAAQGAVRREPPDAYHGALLIDANNGNHDRVSAALELSGDEAIESDTRSAALARAAVEDGRTSLTRIDLGRVEFPKESFPLRYGTLALAMLIALVPLVLSLSPSPASKPIAAPTPGRTTVAAADESAENRNTTTPANPRENTTPRRDAEQPAATTRSGAPTGRTPPSVDPRATNAGAGSGTQPTPSNDAAQQSESAAAKAAAKGGSSSNASGASGKGAAASESSENQQQKDEAKRKATTPKEQKGAQTEQKDKDPSSGSPSGSSRGGGKLAAVGNERSGVDRGVEREDELDSEDEDVQDEKEETEQRGGVVPTKRDRRSAATRELSISGNGPPGDGRGGPTPPKKSRGTASLVLGIRLPDQVRGRPNPGTAKTSIEPVPATAANAEARGATASPSDGPSPHVQSVQPTLPTDTGFLSRYAELVRKLADQERPAPRNE